MGLLITFSAAVIVAASGVAAVLAGGGTTQLVIALAIYVLGTIVALVALVAALDAG
jgi:hypothetical protein